MLEIEGNLFVVVNIVINEIFECVSEDFVGNGVCILVGVLGGLIIVLFNLDFVRKLFVMC